MWLYELGRFEALARLGVINFHIFGSNYLRVYFGQMFECSNPGFPVQ